jgi:hypothetical protein
MVTEQLFEARHRIIARLRVAREQGLPLEASHTDLCALLDEVDQLQLVAHAANTFIPFTLRGLEEPQSVLRDALRTWKT